MSNQYGSHEESGIYRTKFLQIDTGRIYMWNDHQFAHTFGTPTKESRLPSSPRGMISSAGSLHFVNIIENASFSGPFDNV